MYAFVDCELQNLRVVWHGDSTPLTGAITPSTCCNSPPSHRTLVTLGKKVRSFKKRDGLSADTSTGFDLLIATKNQAARAVGVSTFVMLLSRPDCANPSFS